jgi:hypothetical protein
MSRQLDRVGARRCHSVATNLSETHCDVTWSESLAPRAGCSRSWSAAAVSRAVVTAMILGTAGVALPLELAVIVRR